MDIVLVITRNLVREAMPVGRPGWRWGCLERGPAGSHVAVTRAMERFHELMV